METGAFRNLTPGAVPARRALERDLLVVLDEMPRLGYLKPVGMAAGKGIHFRSFAQSISALDATRSIERPSRISPGSCRCRGSRGPARGGHARSPGARPRPAATVLTPEGGNFNDDLATPQTPVARLVLFPGSAPVPCAAVRMIQRNPTGTRRTLAVNPHDLMEAVFHLVVSSRHHHPLQVGCVLSVPPEPPGAPAATRRRVQ